LRFRRFCRFQKSADLIAQNDITLFWHIVFPRFVCRFYIFWWKSDFLLLADFYFLNRRFCHFLNFYSLVYLNRWIQLAKRRANDENHFFSISINFTFLKISVLVIHFEQLDIFELTGFLFSFQKLTAKRCEVQIERFLDFLLPNRNSSIFKNRCADWSVSEGGDWWNQLNIDRLFKIAFFTILGYRHKISDF